MKKTHHHHYHHLLETIKRLGSCPENHHTISQQTFTCWMSTTETLKKCVKYVDKVVMVSLLLTWTYFKPSSSDFVVDVEEVNVYCDLLRTAFLTYLQVPLPNIVSYNICKGRTLFLVGKSNQVHFYYQKTLCIQKISHVFYFAMGNRFLQFFFLFFWFIFYANCITKNKLCLKFYSFFV